MYQLQEIHRIKAMYEVLDDDYHDKVDALNAYIDNTDDFNMSIDKLTKRNEDAFLESRRGYVIAALNQSKSSRTEKDSTVEIKNAKDGMCMSVL